MSVRTTADEKLDKAKELLEEVKRLLKLTSSELLEFLDEETWGSDEYKKEYKDEVRELLLDLIRFKPTL